MVYNIKPLVNLYKRFGWRQVEYTDKRYIKLVFGTDDIMHIMTNNNLSVREYQQLLISKFDYLIWHFDSLIKPTAAEKQYKIELEKAQNYVAEMDYKKPFKSSISEVNELVSQLK